MSPGRNWQLEQLLLVRSVSDQIANVIDLDELARRVTKLIVNTFQYYYVAIFTFEEHRGELIFRANSGRTLPDDPDLCISQLQVVKPGEGIIGTAAAKGEEILAEDVHTHPFYRYIDDLPDTRCEVALPLKVEEKVVGVLDIQSDEQRTFHKMDILVLRSLANNIAMAIQTARLYSGLQRRADQITTVREVSNIIASILDLDEMLAKVVNLVRKRFGYPYVHIFSVHPGRRKIFYQAGSGARSEKIRQRDLIYELDDPQGLIPWVAREGKSLLINDVSKESLYRISKLPPLNTLSELTVPLRFGKTILGVFDIQSDQLNAFDQDDVFVCEALADNIAIAMRNATLYRSEKWRRQVADSLREVAGLISAEGALDEVLDKILIELERNLPCEISSIWLVDEDSEGATGSIKLSIAAARGGDLQAIEQARASSPETDQWLQQALLADQPEIRGLDDPYGPLGMSQKYPKNYSSIVAPLKVGNRPVGLLILAHHAPSRYGSEAQTVTETFASYAAVAIENARLYESAQEQAWVSTVLLQVAEATQSIDNVEELVTSIVHLTPLLVGVKGCAIWLQDEVKEDEYGLIAHHGFNPDDISPQFIRFRTEDSVVIRSLMESKQPILYDPEIYRPDAFILSQPNGSILLPLVTRGGVLGIILVKYGGEIKEVGEQVTLKDQQLSILQGIAHQTAIAIENIRLLESQQQETYISAALLQVAQAIVGSENLNDILDTIAHITPILVGVERCLIYLLDSEKAVYRLAQSYGFIKEVEKTYVDVEYKSGSFPLLDVITKTNKVINYPITNGQVNFENWAELPVTEADADREPIVDDQTVLLMGFPISMKNEPYGVILTEEHVKTNAIHLRRQEIIIGITQQVALAVQNDRLQYERIGRERLEQDIQLAREIQRTFLPERLPTLIGWDIDVLWRPARQVGGDFYDVFDLPDDKLGMVIADVSDKGMPAALFMTLARTLVRAAALETTSPAAALARANQLLNQDAPHGMFVTVFYAVLSTDTGELLYSNAGHNLPIWVHSEDNSIETFLKCGMPLGIMDGLSYTEHNVKIQRGDSLVLYTDGVTEAFSPDNDMYGEDRLYRTVKSIPCDSAQSILKAINNSVTDFIQGGVPGDDITLLALRRVEN